MRKTLLWLLLLAPVWGQSTPVPVELRTPAPVPSPAAPSPTPMPLRIVSHSIWAPNQMVKPIMVTVKVKNISSDARVEGASLRVTLTPHYHVAVRAHPPGDAAKQEPLPDALSPLTLEGPLNRLEPGQVRDYIFETPYMASSAFHSSGTTIMVENLIPNLRHSVPISLDLKLVAP